MTVSPVFELVCGAQSYDWGKLGKDGSKVSQFAQGLPGFKYDEEKPYAELWMGTHPSCPSTLLETGENLKEYLKQHPELIGDNVIKHFGDDLPFLFKVLAIRKALSIQAHPDKKLAKKLYDERPDIYKGQSRSKRVVGLLDPNHKPEMAVALTPFSGFCGFRRPSEIASFLSSVPEFASVVGDKVAESFRSKFGDTSSPSEEDKKAGLKDLFSALMKADEANVKTQVEHLVERLAKEKNQTEETRLVATLNEDFPGDVGVFCTFCLNIVHLKPGEAVFLKANEPHAYLDGGMLTVLFEKSGCLLTITCNSDPDIMECMATSDNVVRAGLTPKLRDYTTLYDPPIEEFSVLLTVLEQGQTEKFEPIDGPSILIFTELQGGASAGLKVGQKKGSKVKRTGQVFFIGAGVEAEIEATGGKVVAYRAFVEAP
ncbi:BQ2448_1741 [Microbotryum intermedium]|uniref:Mannose-6-phosphate isomerase n=1 Tax=Microbotryum intermedium TaxID=269621 RepID=A0A238FB07_9BASI|nr:BQ2448_1741 [Microbotryum intermedium]